MDNKYNIMDIINIMSFVIGMMNYDENLTQNDKQDFINAISDQTNTILTDIHNELEKQNKMLEVLIHDKDKEIG